MTIKEWWSNLAAKEKQAVTLGGVCVTIFMMYAAIWSPLMSSVASMRVRIQSQQRSLIWMKQADSEIQKLEGQGGSGKKLASPVAVLSMLQNQVNQAGLEQYLSQLKQTSNDAISMNFTKVPFDKLIVLLTAVLKQGNASVSQMSVLADTTPGIVSADIQLKI